MYLYFPKCFIYSDICSDYQSDCHQPKAHNFMLRYPKDSNPSSLRKRSESEEATSKIKPYEDCHPRRINSIDSKDKLLTDRKKELSIPFEFEEIATVKGNPSSMKSCRRQEPINLDFVSDIEEDNSSEENQNLTEIPFGRENKNNYNFSVFIQNDKRLSNQEQGYFGAKSVVEYQESEKKKRKVVRELLKKNPFPKNKIRNSLKCPFCREPMNKQDSLMLACTHRYHQNCIVKMRMRNRYECDLCETKGRQCSWAQLGKMNSREQSGIRN